MPYAFRLNVGTLCAFACLGIDPQDRAIRRPSMSSTTDKIKGYANEVAGAVKKGVGNTVGDDKLRAEGTVQNVTGKAQVGVAKVKEAVKNVVDKA